MKVDQDISDLPAWRAVAIVVKLALQQTEIRLSYTCYDKSTCLECEVYRGVTVRCRPRHCCTQKHRVPAVPFIIWNDESVAQSKGPLVTRRLQPGDQ